MSANKEKCADQDKSVCDYNEFRRLHYFHGMLLDDKDFGAEQQYHVNKRRFLNRMLHGSGVVCGLELNGKKGGQWIEVTSGLALDCSGNEIWVPGNTRIDLASLLPPKEKGRNRPECEEEVPGKPNTYYVGIRYHERPSNPVSVYMTAGSCDERSCENSRYKEGYCVEIVECCAEKYPSWYGLLKGFCECTEDFKKPEKEEDLPLCPSCQGLEGKELCQCLRLEKFCERSVPCPECGSCERPCAVVLGQITVDEDGRLKSACINECRRYVLTGRTLQHMLLGVLVGAVGNPDVKDDYFFMKVGDREVPLPNPAELAHNPIKALCWLLRYGLVEGGSLEATDCGKRKGGPDRPPDPTQLSAMHAQVQTIAAEMSKISNEARLQQERLVEVEKATAARPAPTDAAAAPAAPKTPKASTK